MNDLQLAYFINDDVSFDTLEEAVEELVQIHTENGLEIYSLIGSEIKIEYVSKPSHSDFFSVNYLVEEMQNNAYSESEYADDYLNEIEKNDEKLSELSSLIEEWFNKNAKVPNYLEVKNSYGTVVITEDLLKDKGYLGDN